MPASERSRPGVSAHDVHDRRGSIPVPTILLHFPKNHNSFPLKSLQAKTTKPTPDWKGGEAVALAMEAKAGTLESGELYGESDRYRRTGHSKTGHAVQISNKRKI